jgi:hypothetical protein
LKLLVTAGVTAALLLAAYLLFSGRDDFTVPQPDADSAAPFEVPPPSKASVISIPLEADLSSILAEAKAGISNPVAQGSELVNVPIRVHLELFATRTVRKAIQKLESKTVEETRRECERSERRCARVERRVEKICRDVPWPLNEICDAVDSAVCIAHETTCVAWQTVVVGTRIVQVPITVIEEIEEEFVEIIDQVTDLDAELDYTINFVDLDVNLDGQTLRGVVDVDYKIKLNARLNALEGKIKLAEVNGLTSCGYDEPMRRLRMHFSADVTTLEGAALAMEAPSWSLEWPNACQLTAFDIQLEHMMNLPLVEGAVKKAIDKALDKARAKANGSLRFQDRLAGIWPDMRSAIELGDAGWIAINPERVWIAPISGNGKTARTVATIAARPVVSDAQPKPTGPATAPLAGLGSQTPGLSLRVAAGMSYASATSQINASLKDIAPDFVTISDVTAYSSFGRLVLSVRLDAPVRGTLYLIGTPFLEGEARVDIRDIDYSIDSRNALLAVADQLFHDRLRAVLREAAVLDFSAERDAALQAFTEKEIPLDDKGSVSLSVDTVALDEMRIMERGIYALLRLEGSASAKLTP